MQIFTRMRHFENKIHICELINILYTIYGVGSYKPIMIRDFITKKIYWKNLNILENCIRNSFLFD